MGESQGNENANDNIMQMMMQMITNQQILIDNQRVDMQTQKEIIKAEMDSQKEIMKAEMENQKELIQTQSEAIQTLLAERSERGSDTTEGWRHRGPSVNALEKQIRNFSYHPEDGVTFDSWMDRHRVIFESDLSDMADGDKGRVLLRHVDDKVYKQFRDHILPKSPSDLGFDEIITAMIDLFGEKKSIFEKRLDVFGLKMSKLKCNDIKEFSSIVNRVVEEANLKDMQLEQFKAMVMLTGIDLPRYTATMFHVMSGIQSEKAPTIESILRVVDTYKEVYGDAHALSNLNNPQVNAVRRYGRDWQRRAGEVTRSDNFGKEIPSNVRNEVEFKRRCDRCDRSHMRSECPHISSICFNCDKTGHLSVVCKEDSDLRERRNSQEKRVNVIIVNSAEDRSSFDREMKLNGIPITMMPDTGSDLTIISNDTWVKIGRPPLSETNVKAICANEGRLSVRGFCKLNIEMNGCKTQSNVYIFFESKVNVLGKDNFGSFFQLIPRSVNDSSQPEEEILHKEQRMPRSTVDWDCPMVSSSRDKVLRKDLEADSMRMNFLPECSEASSGRDKALREALRGSGSTVDWDCPAGTSSQDKVLPEDPMARANEEQSGSKIDKSSLGIPMIVEIKEKKGACPVLESHSKCNSEVKTEDVMVRSCAIEAKSEIIESRADNRSVVALHGVEWDSNCDWPDYVKIFRGTEANGLRQRKKCRMKDEG